MNAEYPDFDIAEDRFRAFLTQQGVTASELLYVTPEDVAIIGHRVLVRPTQTRVIAKQTYGLAVGRARATRAMVVSETVRTICSARQRR